MQIVSRPLLNLLTLWNPRISAMALWPFIIFKDQSCKLDAVILNHEKIHHRQQIELLLLPYYVWYFLEYWTAMFRNGFNHQLAYMGVSFEQEAFAHQNELDYLSKRSFLGSWPFFRNKFRSS